MKAIEYFYRKVKCVPSELLNGERFVLSKGLVRTMKTREYGLPLVFLLILSILLTANINWVRGSLTTVFVDPSYVTNVSPGETFSINISIADVTDLGGWEFQLFYDSQALNGTATEEGTFLSNVRSTIFMEVDFDDDFNETHGRVWLTCTFLGSGSGASGSGTLAVLTFGVKTLGHTLLSLPTHLTKLVDSTPMPPGPQPIPHTTIDGWVATGIVDAAVIDLQLSETEVYGGKSITVAVVVANHGDFPESIDVTTYYNDTIFSFKTVPNLDAGSQTVLFLTLDTTGLAVGSYFIRAVASPLLGETNLGNNEFVDGILEIRQFEPLIVIFNAISCDQSGYPKNTFLKGTISYFKVSVNNTSDGLESVLVTVNVYDASNATLGVVSFKGGIMPGVSVFILGLPLPSGTSTGTATVYANALTDWPYFGGIPYCPEISATFEVVD